jgi:hypothetical protein
MLRLVTLLVCACACSGCFLIAYPVVSLAEDVRGRLHNGRVAVAGVVTDSSGRPLVEGTTIMYVHSVRVTGIESLESGSAKVDEDETARSIGTSFDLKFNDIYQVDLLFRHAGFADVRQRYRLVGDLWILGCGGDDRFDRTVVGPSPLIERAAVIRMKAVPAGGERPDSVYVWPGN